jgi:hypothetical protein
VEYRSPAFSPLHAIHLKLPYYPINDLVFLISEGKVSNMTVQFVRKCYRIFLVNHFYKILAQVNTFVFVLVLLTVDVDGKTPDVDSLQSTLSHELYEVLSALSHACQLINVIAFYLHIALPFRLHQL